MLEDIEAPSNVTGLRVPRESPHRADNLQVPWAWAWLSSGLRRGHQAPTGPAQEVKCSMAAGKGMG
jgi:hypothetical protein